MRIAGLLAVIMCFAASPAASAQDRLFGPDKALHFSVSAGLAAGGYGLSSPWLDEPVARASVGAGLSLTLGVGKEFYDHAQGGPFSGRDLAWDVLGTTVGVLVAWAVNRLFEAPPAHASP